MKVTIFCLNKEETISLDVQKDLSLQNFRALCSIELNINQEQMLLVHNGRPLMGDTQTLESCQVQDNDMIVLQQIPPAAQGRVPQGHQQSNRPAGIPRINFAAIRMPGQATISRPQAPSRNTGTLDMNDPETLRQKFLNSPHDLALLKERNPAFAEAIIKGGDAFAKQLEEMRDAQAQIEREKIRMLNADPLDPDVQNKIAEEIQQKNIQENMNMAIEEAPETFGKVFMLWINIKVNGHSVKAFVDSGAQMTSMSVKFAEECHIMRLVDRRWNGIAKGVGTQKIIGRIHLVQMQIENDFLQCSIFVLEDPPTDILLGLDMLRRHQCCIDLRENKLCIGTTGTETPFLHESELPMHDRLHDPTLDEGATSAQEDELTAKAIQESVEEALRQEKNSPKAPNAGFSGAGTSPGAATTSHPDSAVMVPESDLKQLTDLGFSREAAEQEIRKCNGDAQLAKIKLLARSMRTKK